jgi:hypothetical protein
LHLAKSTSYETHLQQTEMVTDEGLYPFNCYREIPCGDFLIFILSQPKHYFSAFGDYDLVYNLHSVLEI